MNTSQLVPGRVRVGANPIIWSNDDFAELNGDLPLNDILRDMRLAGYEGTELGHAYPREAAALSAALAPFALRLASGWHSTYFATRDHDGEFAALAAHLSLLRANGATVAIVAECSHCIHGDRDSALGYGTDDRATLSADEWTRLVAGLRLAVLRAGVSGMTLAYHHHMGTCIQTEEELNRLLTEVPGLQLVLDPGHLSFAGIDPLAIVRRWGSHIVHCHLKSTRSEVLQRARRERWSFCQAVKQGVFTIPGEGAVDFPAIFRALAELAYSGWLIVEAEEDPVLAPPLPKARQARDYVRRQTGV